MLNLKSYSKSNLLQEAAFVQLKNPETGALEFTESGEPIGFELYSVQSKEFTRAMRKTAHLGLTKSEQEKQVEILGWIADGTKPSEENLEYLEYCEDKVVKRFQRVFAMVTKKLHHITLEPEDAESIGVKVSKLGRVTETVDNIHQLYIALPDLSSQIGDSIRATENFTKASQKA